VQVIAAVMGGDSSFYIDRERLKLLPRRAFIDLTRFVMQISRRTSGGGARDGTNSFLCAATASRPAGGTESRRREFQQVASLRTP
jgi:hypothetical protein